MPYHWCRHHNFLLKWCKTWKNLVFVGNYNSPNDRSLHLLSTKPNFAHFVSFPLGGNVPIYLFWQKLGAFEVFRALKTWKSKLCSFCGLPAWWKSTHWPLLCAKFAFSSSQSFRAFKSHQICQKKSMSGFPPNGTLTKWTKFAFPTF